MWRKVNDFHYAEEITQDTFLQAYKKLSTLKNPNQFAGWLYVIANRLCINWLQRHKPAMQSLEDTPMEEINVEVFNPKTNQWQERTEMSVPKANHSTSVIDGKIYVMGGYFQEDRKVKSLSAIEVYDPATDRWTQESDMLIGRSGHTTEVVDGQIYILGGIAVGKGLLTSVEVYDLREVSQRVNSTGKL